jgi:hypothetical protein
VWSITTAGWILRAVRQLSLADVVRSVEASTADRARDSLLALCQGSPVLPKKMIWISRWSSRRSNPAAAELPPSPDLLPMTLLNPSIQKLPSAGSSLQPMEPGLNKLPRPIRPLLAHRSQDPASTVVDRKSARLVWPLRPMKSRRDRDRPTRARHSKEPPISLQAQGSTRAEPAVQASTRQERDRVPHGPVKPVDQPSISPERDRERTLRERPIRREQATEQDRPTSRTRAGIPTRAAITAAGRAAAVWVSLSRARPRVRLDSRDSRGSQGSREADSTARAATPVLTRNDHHHWHLYHSPYDPIILFLFSFLKKLY